MLGHDCLVFHSTITKKTSGDLVFLNQMIDVHYLRLLVYYLFNIVLFQKVVLFLNRPLFMVNPDT